MGLRGPALRSCRGQVLGPLGLVGSFLGKKQFLIGLVPAFLAVQGSAWGPTEAFSCNLPALLALELSRLVLLEVAGGGSGSGGGHKVERGVTGVQS